MLTGPNFETVRCTNYHIITQLNPCLGIPLMYFSMLFRKRETLCDPIAMDREVANNFPTVGSLVFLVESYKPEFWYFEVCTDNNFMSRAPLVRDDSTFIF